MLTSVAVSLRALLNEAASAADWQREVVHRCAWCKRIAGPDGEYQEAVVLPITTVTTDGICPSCASTALARIHSRPRRPSLVHAQSLPAAA